MSALSNAVRMCLRDSNSWMAASVEEVDTIVVGAGVVGLAVGRALALQGREVIVLESENAIGTGASSRNSEVIHAGIYYPANSLKARLCVAGKHALYAYARERGFAARAIGKLIVATSPAQLPGLEALRQAAHTNGVPDVERISPEEAKALEPQVACVAALWSPSSGIVDSHSFMLALQGDLENAGGVVAFGTPVVRARLHNGGIEVETGGAQPMRLACRLYVNAAGLGAPDLAHALEGFPKQDLPRAFYAKGNYFGLTGMRSPFRHLVYPMPEQAGLGIHATIDLGGQVRFGPDVEWVDAPDYTPNPARLGAFEVAIRTYWPGLPDGALQAQYCGVRPKIVGPGIAAADFRIDGPREHGVDGVVNLLGIESPGLTSALAIADEVVRRLN